MKLLESSRDIFLVGEVNEETLTHLLFSIKTLEVSSTKPINIHLYTLGGEIGIAFACYDAILTSKCKYNIYCYGEVYSSGTIILQAANNRISMPNCTFMIHDISVSVDNNYNHAKQWMKSVTHSQEKMKDLYLLKFTNITRQKLTQLLKEERYLSADEAKTFGMVDKIL